MRTFTNISLVIISLFTTKINAEENLFNNQILSEIKVQSESGSVLLADRTGIIVNEHYGVTNSDISVSTLTHKWADSGMLNDQFTTVSILQLMENGMLSLDSPILTYFPEIPLNIGQDITIEHLLANTSGLTEATLKHSNLQSTSSNQNWIVINNSKLKFLPGDQYQYNKINYILLRNIIEQISGLSYPNYVTEHLIEPSKLKNTSFFTSLKNAQNSSSVNMLSRKLISNIAVGTPLLYSEVPLFNTSEDLYKWTNSLYSNEIISQRSLNLALTPYTLNSGVKLSAGYSWKTGNVQGIASIKSGGDMTNYSSYCQYIPSQDVFVVVLCNSKNDLDLNKITSKFAAILMGNPYKMDNTKYSNNNLSALTGKYQNATGETMTITVENKIPYLINEYNRKKRLSPYAKNKYHISGELVTFTVQSSNKKNPVTILENNTFTIREWVLLNKDISDLEPTSEEKSGIKKFSGKYRTEKNEILTIVFCHDTLYSLFNGEKTHLAAISEQVFVSNSGDLKYQFVQDKDQNIIGLYFDNGTRIKAVKLIASV